MGITLLTKEIKPKNIFCRNEVQYRDDVPYLQHQYQFSFVLIIQIVNCVHE